MLSIFNSFVFIAIFIIILFKMPSYVSKDFSGPPPSSILAASNEDGWYLKEMFETFYTFEDSIHLDKF